MHITLNNVNYFILCLRGEHGLVAENMSSRDSGFISRILHCCNMITSVTLDKFHNIRSQFLHLLNIKHHKVVGIKKST